VLFKISSQTKSRPYKPKLYTSDRIAKCVQIVIRICPSLIAVGVNPAG